MPRAARFPVVVGTDGSPVAQAAVAAALIFPWPEGTTIYGVVARRTRATAGRPGYVRAAFDRAFEHASIQARRRLAARWPDADVSVVDRSPIRTILGEARRLGARVVVVGQRGHGRIGRLLLGSTSRAVARRAACSVLVVNRRPRRLRHLVVGVDGSAHSERAVALVAELPPPSGSVVTLVTAIEATRTAPYPRLTAAIRARADREVATRNAGLTTAARRELDRAAAIVRAAGWRVRTVLRAGPPLDVLLAAVESAGADLLVLGARGAGRLDRFLPGSVAEGALNHSGVPVLLVR